jgi:hypothetical protein
VPATGIVRVDQLLPLGSGQHTIIVGPFDHELPDRPPEGRVGLVPPPIVLAVERWEFARVESTRLLEQVELQPEEFPAVSLTVHRIPGSTTFQIGAANVSLTFQITNLRIRWWATPVT